MTLNPNLGTHIHASYSPKQEIRNLLLTTLYAATLKKEDTVSLPCSLEDSHQLPAPGARLKILSVLLLEPGPLLCHLWQKHAEPSDKMLQCQET